MELTNQMAQADVAIEEITASVAELEQKRDKVGYFSFSYLCMSSPIFN